MCVNKNFLGPKRPAKIWFFLFLNALIAWVPCTAETWYVSKDDGSTCRKLEATERPFPIGKNSTMEELLRATSGGYKQKLQPWSISQKELELYDQIQTELNRMLLTHPDVDEPLPVIASKLGVEPEYLDRVFILGMVVRTCIREGKLSTSRESNKRDRVIRPPRIIYSVLDRTVSDTPLKTQIELRLLVVGDIIRDEMEAVLREVWIEEMSKHEYRYHPQPNMIGIFAYLSEVDFRNSGANWVGRLLWSDSDPKGPKIDISR